MRKNRDGNVAADPEDEGRLYIGRPIAYDRESGRHDTHLKDLDGERVIGAIRSRSYQCYTVFVFDSSAFGRRKEISAITDIKTQVTRDSSLGHDTRILFCLGRIEGLNIKDH